MKHGVEARRNIHCLGAHLADEYALPQHASKRADDDASRPSKIGVTLVAMIEGPRRQLTA